MVRGLAATLLIAVVATISGDVWTGLAAAVAGISATLLVARPGGS